MAGCCCITDLAHAAGAFVGPDGKGLPVPEGLPNAHMRLFGGAQYHRCAHSVSPSDMLTSTPGTLHACHGAGKQRPVRKTRFMGATSLT